MVSIFYAEFDIMDASPSDLGDEVLTNSTIENWKQETLSSIFHFDFENGNMSLVIILGSGLLITILAVAFYIFYCGYPWFGCFGCICRKRAEHCNREHYNSSIHLKKWN